MNIKLPRIPKSDGNKYNTGDAQNWTYKYTDEDIKAVRSMIECPSEPMPTMKQIFEYGVLNEISDDISDMHSKQIKDAWEAIVNKLNKNEPL